MFERFNDRARRVVVLAKEESRLLGHSYIGTEHLLLGLIEEAMGSAAVLLIQHGATLERARETVAIFEPRTDKRENGHIPFTPRCRKVLDLSLREAINLNDNFIGVQHLLLALVREGEGIACKALAEMGIEPSTIRPQLMALLGVPPAEGGTERSRDPLDRLRGISRDRPIETCEGTRVAVVVDDRPIGLTLDVATLLRHASELAGGDPINFEHIDAALGRLG